MGNHPKSRAELISQGITLNSLKEQLYSLNMRLRLAMQSHDEAKQETLEKQMAALQEDIDCIGSGVGLRH